ncbi:PepSY-associated TM helix domain-containing protein [Abyssibacter profundi]|uniref:PepSY domain-containing protein n=1 Tax=Abyssibacter profundi TaxID=2182787 RepID=A0A383XQE1_9GAMM|nr:PepSY-associated TM helix domain-containing protein [Abyssibacter profundi]PWN54845.1 PepSY domain-containing protein [Abyssibacter profundi]
MIKLSQERTKHLLSIHGWSGVLLGLLLYAVICTGTVAVFSTEIGDWSNPLATPSETGLPSGINTLVQTLADQVDPAYREEFFLFSSAGGRLMLQFEGHQPASPTPGSSEPAPHYGVLYAIDPNRLQVINRVEGPEAVLDEARHVADALADFFVELHVRLHIPSPWGLFVTGVLGLIMMVAAITGFLVHRHLIRELFTIRRHKDGLLRARDAHVIAGTWTLPFAFVLAFTGSFFSFATSLGLPAMAMVVFEGDQERALAEVFGEPATIEDRDVPVANLDAILNDAEQRTGVRPNFVAGGHWGKAGAEIRVFSPAREGMLTGRSPVYAAESGQFLRDQPVLVGQQPSAGNTVAALMAPLHFGHFAGLASKAAWFALGFAGAYVALTGLLLWTQRRATQPFWQRMTRVVHWVGYGLPLSMAMTPYGTFVAQSKGWPVLSAQWWVFGCGVLLSLFIAGLARSSLHIRRCIVALTGLALLGLPAVRMLTGGPGWAEALSTGRNGIVAGDLVMLCGALACWLLCWFGARPADQRKPVHAASTQEAVV